MASAWVTACFVPSDTPLESVPMLPMVAPAPFMTQQSYSTWARGTDIVGSAYSFLDLTALGRQEEWEEPKGRAPKPHEADPSFSD